MSKRKLTKEQERELMTSRFTAPIKFEVTGHFELTEKQKKENEKWEKELERRYGKNKINK